MLYFDLVSYFRILVYNLHYPTRNKLVAIKGGVLRWNDRDKTHSSDLRVKIPLH